MADESTPPAAESNKQEKVFHVIILVLIAVIVVTLGALWMVERRGRMRALGALSVTEGRVQKLEGALRQMVLNQGLTVTVDRDDLPTQEVQLNGQPTRVLLLSARMGGRLGFKPGDTIMVSAQTQPASEATSSQAASSAKAE